MKTKQTRRRNCLDQLSVILKGIFCCLIISAVFVNCLYGCGAGRPSRRVDVLNGFLWLDGLFRPSPIHHLTPWWWGTQNSNGQQKGAHAQKPNRATLTYAGGYRWVYRWGREGGAGMHLYNFAIETSVSFTNK